MLDTLRDRAASILAEIETCTLATTGPAGVQASVVRCKGQGTDLYLYIPNTSDHLFNLEHVSEVALATEEWYLRGKTQVLDEMGEIFDEQEMPWHTVVKVKPLQMHILPGDDNKHAETIDFFDNNPRQ